MSEPVPDDVQAMLERWTSRGRALFAEVMEDAGSDLQREFVHRAVLAGHTAGEVHAFADELRALSDDECFERCTLDDDAPDDYTVVQLLRAEADPLFAFELKGGTISPNEADDAPSLPVPRAAVLDEGDHLMRVADPVRRAREQRAGFSAESVDARPSRQPAAAVSRPPNSGLSPSLVPSTGSRIFDDLLTEATRGLSISWREYEVDVPGGLTMEALLPQAATALSRGVPVPCVVGSLQTRALRFVVMLQLSTSGANRAFQLYEPFSQELIWANEKDLLARGELNFSNKALRKVTRVALPQTRRP